MAENRNSGQNINAETLSASATNSSFKTNKENNLNTANINVNSQLWMKCFIQ